jgi:hypothetical protein
MLSYLSRSSVSSYIHPCFPGHKLCWLKTCDCNHRACEPFTAADEQVFSYFWLNITIPPLPVFGEINSKSVNSTISLHGFRLFNHFLFGGRGLCSNTATCGQSGQLCQTLLTFDWSLTTLMSGYIVMNIFGSNTNQLRHKQNDDFWLDEIGKERV